jgi:hypothetical protein
MSLVEQIEKAIAAHAAWKVRLRRAIAEGKSEHLPANVSVDNQCEFGKWLYSLPAPDQQSQNWRSVRELHASFHKEAGKVLVLALGGKQAEADAGLAPGSPFAKVSLELTNALMRWKTAG